MEIFENKYAVLERCAAENPIVGTEEYNLINGPVDIFKNYIGGIIENEQNSRVRDYEQSNRALEHIYSLVHSSDLDITSKDRVDLCKTIAAIVRSKKELANTTTKETTKRMGIAAMLDIATTAIMVLGKLGQQYLDQQNKSFWKKIFG